MSLMQVPALDPMDRRLNVCSPQLADIRLQNKVKAERYVEGRPGQVTHACADMRKSPELSSTMEAQLLLGQTVQVFDECDGHLWVQSDCDCYVGWVQSAAISFEPVEPTHMVGVARTFRYPCPDLKRPRTGTASLGSLVTVTQFTENRGTSYAILNSGEAMIAGHLRGAGEFAEDYVAVAETLIATPYLWGGSSAFGLDCSGLVQLAMRVAGKDTLRDTDMLAATLGTPVDPGKNFVDLRRGDLAFWRGHVGIVQGDGMMVHANGHTMSVASEPLAEAVERIAYLYEKPIGFKRV